MLFQKAGGNHSTPDGVEPSVTLHTSCQQPEGLSDLSYCDMHEDQTCSLRFAVDTVYSGAIRSCKEAKSRSQHSGMASPVT